MKELIDFFNEKGIKNKSGGDINYNSIQRMLEQSTLHRRVRLPRYRCA